MVTWLQVSTAVKAFLTTALSLSSLRYTHFSKPLLMFSASLVFSDSVVAWPCPNILSTGSLCQTMSSDEEEE